MLDFAADVCIARSLRCDAYLLREADLSHKHTDYGGCRHEADHRYQLNSGYWSM